MADASLVSVDVEGGRQVVEKIRDDKFWDLLAAYWFYNEANDRWRLTLVTPLAAKGTRDLYRRISELDPPFELSLFEFVPPENSVYRALAQQGSFASPSKGFVELVGSTATGVFVQHAFVYFVRPIPQTH